MPWQAGQSRGTDNPVDRRNWLLDRIPPDTRILSGPDNDEDDAAQFEFTALDARSSISHYECRLDDHDWIRCESPFLLQVEAAAGGCQPAMM